MHKKYRSPTTLVAYLHMIFTSLYSPLLFGQSMTYLFSFCKDVIACYKSET